MKVTGMTVQRGNSAPLGSTVMNGGVNFSLFSKHATGVSLLLFDHVDDIAAAATIRLDPVVHKTYHYWHVFVPGIREGQLYGFSVEGPYDPANGHFFDSAKCLLDPYGKAVAYPANASRKDAAQRGESTSPSLKSVVADGSDFDWEGDKLLKHPFAQTVIYEMHVAGFTKHPNSGVALPWRGTYRGLVEKLPYLQALGITAVELLPVFQFDPQDAPEERVNYWGYAPVSFFAPHHAYCSSDKPLDAVREFREMVKACHKAGIEVILDVVFNHTCEGNEHGPTYCFKGIDSKVYYISDASGGFANFSGTGNTLNANHPIVRRMIIDSLHYWVQQMHVDGFRFDLASILSRDAQGHPMANPPVLWDIESDPVLAGRKLIAEAWDAAGLYQVGTFIGDNWKEWNGRFRDDIRSFMKGDEGKLSALVSKILGSPDVYGHEEREPEQSINFVTCHDGFTLNDLVSYNGKHNEANGEDNRDGGNDNLSWNCGVEGPSDDPQVEAFRSRQVRNFLALNLISIGTPMLLMGDEVRRTQHGNNNAYCQDNELSWFDWSLTEKYADILRFTQVMVGIRRRRELSNRQFAGSLNKLLQRATITWHGTRLNQPDWSHTSRSIACTIHSMSGKHRMHFLISSWNHALTFELPPANDGFGPWKLWLDTAQPSPHDVVDWADATEVKEQEYSLQPFTIAFFISERN